MGTILRATRVVQVGAPRKLAGVPGAVDPDDHFPVGAARGGQFLVAFVELES